MEKKTEYLQIIRKGNNNWYIPYICMPCNKGIFKCEEVKYTSFLVKYNGEVEKDLPCIRCNQPSGANMPYHNGDRFYKVKMKFNILKKSKRIFCDWRTIFSWKTKKL
jgi:hypothetical protein